MSGLGFQKKNGAGTQMQNLIDKTTQILTELKNQKSDLYRTAKEFNLNKVLNPVSTSWLMDFNIASSQTIDFGGLYFGKWQISHTSQKVGTSDNSSKRSLFRLYHISAVVAQTEINIHGDDILAWDSTTTEHFGFATGAVLQTMIGDDEPEDSAVISFIGYKVTDAAEIPAYFHWFEESSTNSIDIYINSVLYQIGGTNSGHDILGLSSSDVIHVLNNSGQSVDLLYLDGTFIAHLMSEEQLPPCTLGDLYHLGVYGFKVHSA